MLERRSVFFSGGMARAELDSLHYPVWSTSNRGHRLQNPRVMELGMRPVALTEFSSLGVACVARMGDLHAHLSFLPRRNQAFVHRPVLATAWMADYPRLGPWETPPLGPCQRPDASPSQRCEQAIRIDDLGPPRRLGVAMVEMLRPRPDSACPRVRRREVDRRTTATATTHAETNQ